MNNLPLLFSWFNMTFPGTASPRLRCSITLNGSRRGKTDSQSMGFSAGKRMVHVWKNQKKIAAFYLSVIFQGVFFLQSAAQPVISSFSPASGPVGTTVTIIGSGYSPTPASNTVYFGAVKAVVSTASATSLTVIVPAGTTFQPLTVTTNNLIAYSGKPFIITFPANAAGFIPSSFASKVDYTTGNTPYQVSTGDLDGDGKVDMVVANFLTTTVSVIRNTSTGGMVSFATKVDYVSGSNPANVSIGDLDGDGKPEMIVANLNSFTISVFKNTSTSGTISFASKIDYTTGTAPRSIAIADLDGDGKPDLAVNNYFSSTVSVFRNTGSGGVISFAAKSDYAIDGSSYSISAGDLDGDGKPDLAVANYSTSSVSVLRNTSTSGTVSFAAKINYATGTDPYSIAIGDFDGDNKADLAVANSSSGTVSVLRNQSAIGTISFTAKVDYTTGSNPYNVAISDLNGDGKPDLAIANYGSNTVSVLRNLSTSGAISLAAKVDYATGSTPYSIAIGDLDGDAKPDLAVTNSNSGTVSILKNQVDAPNIAAFTPTNAPVGTTVAINGTSFTGATAVSFGGIAATSFTVVSDILITAVVGAVTGGTVTVTTPKGTAVLGGFYNGHTITSFSPASGPVGTTVTISGSGFSTVASGNIVYFGAVKAAVSAATSTSLTVTVPVGASYQPIIVTTNNLTAYANKPFVVTFSSGATGVTPNAFAAKVDYTPGSRPYSISISDLDGDGKTDLAVANSSSSTVSVLRNTATSGTVSFAAKVDYATGGSPYSVSTSDLDGDGKPDLAVANYASNTVSVFRNTSTNGTITFAAKTDYITGSSPSSVAIGDVDGDGKPDLAVANYASNTVSVFRNTGTGGVISFETKIDFATGFYPYSVVIGDLDGDGKPDLAVANYVSNTVSVFRNTSNAGTVSFAAKVDYATGDGPFSVAIGDLDGDGKPDLAAASYANGTVSVLRNQSAIGTISFTAKVDYTTGSNPYNVTFGELDGDGKPDLAIANYGSNTVSVLRNLSTSGAMSFASKVDYATGSNPNSIAIGDLDGDAKPDLAVTNSNSGTVSILKNQVDAPNIAAFTPTNAPVGTTVAINGTSFTGTTAVTLGDIAATSFTVVSDILITAVVGAVTGGTVTVTTPKGTAVLGGFYNGHTVTSFSPASGPAGTTVTISGSGFSTVASANTVYFGAVKAAVSAATSTSLTVTVPVGVTYQPITVTTNNLTAYANKSFIVTFPSNPVRFTPNSFDEKIDYTPGSRPYSISISDLDGDGKADLAVANSSSGTVSVLRNTATSGTVSFAAKVDYTTGGSPYSVATGDLDGDGKPDLAVANYASSTVSVFRNTSTNGTVSFAAKIDYATGSSPYSVAIGDLDGDGKPDVAVANYGAGTVSVLRNTGTGGTVSFTAKVDYATGAGPYGVAIGDVNGDGKPDVLVANYGASTVSVLRNMGASGTISFAKVDFATGGTVNSMLIGDLDGDGKPDLVTANYGANTASAFRNTSTGGTVSFAARTDYTTGTSPYGVAIGDLDGDGKPDLVTANYGANTVSVLRNTSASGTVSFASKAEYTTGGSPYSISVGDLDGDGKPDLAIANLSSSTVSILKNQVNAPNIAAFTPTNAPVGTTVAITGTSFNGATAVTFGGIAATSFAVVSDTLITAVVGAVAGGAVTVTTPRGTAALGGFYNGHIITSFSPASGPVGTMVTISGSGFSTVASAHIVYFGAVKAAVSAATATSLTVTVPVGASYQPITVTTNNLTAYTGKPFAITFPAATIGLTANSFDTKIDFTTGNSSYSVAMSDLDGDGKPDLAVANYGAGTVSVLRNTGTGGTVSFAAKVDYATGAGPYSVSIGDVDGDGKPDLAVANSSSGTVSVLRNNSTGGTISFAAKVDYATGSSPFSVSIGDLDGDGKPDLAVANYGSGTVSVLRNISTGGTVSFAAKVDYATGSSPYNVSIGDLEGDGKPDLAVANYASSTVSVLRNTSAGGTVSFAAKVDYVTGSSPYSVSIGDLDGDGKPDLAVANASSNTVSILRNTSAGGTVSFAAKVDYATGSTPYSVAIGDVDGDAKPDLAVANLGSNTVSVFRNTSIGGMVSFAAKVDYAAGNSPYSVAIGDADGDGKPDLAVANLSSNTISVIRNQISTITITTGNITNTSLCAGNQVNIPFTTSLTLNANNVFTAQLSDSTGNFTNAVNIGTLSGASSDTIYAIIPANTLSGLNFRLRVISSSPIVTSIPNANPLNISRIPASNFTITGNPVTCAGLQTYIASGVSGTRNQYHWSLSGGGVLDTTTNNAKVNWTTAGTYTLSLSLSNNCGTSQTNSVQIVVDNTPLSGTFPAMLPSNGNTSLSLPVTFSWFPVDHATNYDLYIWAETSSRPGAPTAANITGISYTAYYLDVQQYEKTFKWQVVAKKACYELASPVQTFKLRNLPDVVVSAITPAATGFSGQPFSINWQVKNIGLGGTLQGQWYDRVYLSADTLLDPTLDVYLGDLPNVSELAPNASYSQTASFTLPQGINNKYYVFVTTNVYRGLQESNTNNNTALSPATTIQLTPPPDLRVISVLPPNFVFSGQDMVFSWKVANLGTGGTRVSAWADDAYLSKDTTLSIAAALYLGNATHTGNLDADSNYAVSRTFRLPDSIFGKYYLYVRTDVNKQVYEHAGENNNTARSDSISIILTPPIDLTVTQVTATPAGVSNKENINVQWRVENVGGSPTENRTWTDNIYLSKTSAFVPDSAILLASVNRPLSLNPGDGYNSQRVIAAPANISGSYFVYVVTDAAKQVYEYNLKSNNVKRSGTAINILSPDLVVSSVAIPSADTSGHEIEVKWKIINNATATLPNTAVTDRISLSANPVYNMGNNRELKLVTYNTGVLAPGDTLSKSAFVRLPNGISGAYYVYLQADYTNTVYEAGRDTNNTARSAAPLQIRLGPWPDLQATVQLYADSAIPNSIVPVSYTIINKGAKQVDSMVWWDKLYISVLPQWDSTNATLLKELLHSGTLPPDSFYTISTSIAIPAQIAAANYYIYVVTDSRNTIFEYTDENNNISRSSTLFVDRYPPVDLTVTSVSAPVTASTGMPITVAWAAQNRSAVPTLQSKWNDALYLSADTVWNRNEDTLVKEFMHTGILQANQSYTNQQTAVLPNNLAGSFYLLLVTDPDDLNKDANRRNNYKAVTQGSSGNPVTISIALTPPADLNVTSFATPFTGQAGQPVTAKWTVKNTGTGVTHATSWTDKIFLSTNPVIDNGDVLLGSYIRQDSLLPGAGYTDSLLVYLPATAQGNYFVLFKTDANNNVYEHLGEENNTANAAITVSRAPVSDLIVSDISIPDSAIAGENITIQWKIKNTGQFPAAGYLKDAVYLSEDTTRDIYDILLVSKELQINLVPQAETVQRFTGELKGAALKNYHVLIHTDVVNNIYESSDSNNVSASIGTMAVTVPLLPVNVLIQKSLTNNKEMYYRIDVPDSLVGETLLIRLNGDSLHGSNEMYLSHNQIPTRAVYGFSYNLPYKGNQEITIPALEAGTYYLLVTGSTTAGNMQQISLLAKPLYFEIRSVNAGRGGNTGTVTVLITGSKLNTVTSLYLRNTGSSLEAYSIKMVDPTKIYATFNLQDAVTGQYDIIAKNSSEDSTSLINGFVIESGTAANLVTNALVPPSARFTGTISITVEFTNAGNTDLINPVLKLSSLGGAPIAFTIPELAKNTMELTLSLQELNGPLAVLRPGASGTVIVYAKATSALSFTLLQPQ